MSRISARIPDELQQKIKNEAKKTGKNKSQVIREKIRKAFNIKNEDKEVYKRIEKLEETVETLKKQMKHQKNLENEEKASIEAPTLDETDKEIIKYACQGTYSLSELSELIGVSENTIYRRINDLKEKNVLKEGYMALPNYKKMGLSFVLTGINVDPEDKEKAIEFLKQKEQVKFLWETLGDHDIVADLLCPGSKKVESVRKLRKDLEKEGIKVQNLDVSESSTSEKIDLKPTF